MASNAQLRAELLLQDDEILRLSTRVEYLERMLVVRERQVRDMALLLPQRAIKRVKCRLGLSSDDEDDEAQPTQPLE